MSHVPDGPVSLDLLTTPEPFTVPQTLQEPNGCSRLMRVSAWERAMDSVIYLIGLVVVIMLVLSMLGLR